MKALPIYVYKTNRLGDCTNGGISSKYDTLLLICEHGYIDIDENNPPENLVKMVRREMCGGIYHIEPYARPQHLGWMAGGNYAETSDSRFRDMVNFYGAVAIHDRQETQEEYDFLSR